MYSHFKPTGFYCKCSLSVKQDVFHVVISVSTFLKTFYKNKVKRYKKNVSTAKQDDFKLPSCMFIIWTKTLLDISFTIYYESQQNNSMFLREICFALPSLKSLHLSLTLQSQVPKYKR